MNKKLTIRLYVEVEVLLIINIIQIYSIDNIIFILRFKRDHLFINYFIDSGRNGSKIKIVEEFLVVRRL